MNETYPESAKPSVLPMSSSMLTFPAADLPFGPATAKTNRFQQCMTVGVPS